MEYNPNMMDEENPIVKYWKTRRDILDDIKVENSLTMCREKRYNQLIKWMNAGVMTRHEFNKEVRMLYGLDSSKEY